ncbi:MAG: hypothetical protein J6I45_01270 [Clostridia bacterium]|nr:hypothetical protein [Clostridia bacterium]
MRKRALCILLMFILCLLPSCDSAEQDDDAPKNIADMYFVYYSNKINAETGNVTPLCTDPLCSHSDEDCQFVGVATDGYTGDRYGNKLIYTGHYWIKNDDPNSSLAMKAQNAIMSYDLLNNKVTIHLDLPSNGSYIMQYYNGNVLTQLMTAPDDIEKPKSEDYIRQLIIINVEDHTLTEWPAVTFPPTTTILDYTGEQIYYADAALNYHVVDKKTGTDRMIDEAELSDAAMKSEYIYSRLVNVPEDENGVWKRFSDGSYRLIIPDAMDAKQVGDLYVYPMLNPEYNTEYGEALYYQLDIWACNLDGSEPRKIFENPGNIYIPYFFTHEAQAAGNHFGIPCLEVVFKEDGTREILHDPNNGNICSFFTLDTLTGEYKTVAVTKLGTGVQSYPAQ